MEAKIEKLQTVAKELAEVLHSARYFISWCEHHVVEIDDEQIAEEYGSSMRAFFKKSKAALENYKTIEKLQEEIKELKHFKDSHVGLWATDIEPEDKTNFFRIKK